MPTRLISEVIENQQVLTMPPETTIRTASLAMKAGRVGSVMVVEHGKLAGIFTERDGLFRVLSEGLDPDTATLGSVMTRNVTTIEADRPLAEALHVMYDNNFRHLPVVKNGAAVGIVSIRDALGVELAHFEKELRKKAEIEEVM